MVGGVVHDYLDHPVGVCFAPFGGIRFSSLGNQTCPDHFAARNARTSAGRAPATRAHQQIGAFTFKAFRSRKAFSSPLKRGYNKHMIHELLAVGPLQCNCSVIGDESTREAMVIDPGDDIENVVALINKHQLKVKHIVITHAHIDHVGGAMKLRARTGAPILLNQNDNALLKMLDVQAAWVGMRPPGEVKITGTIGHADTLRTGDLSCTVLHTPGHTEGSVCLYFPAEKKLLAGDTLFAGSIGRTDLPGGSFEKIIDSLHERVLVLPEDTVVIPGHGPNTTIGEERVSNPFLVKR